MNKTFTCSMQKKKESLAKKSESGDALKKGCGRCYCNRGKTEPTRNW